ncbi:ribonuclease H-like domain-containing protein [Tanacetum coccineum]
MDLESAQTATTAKLPILKQENRNSFKPVAQTTTNADGTSTSLIPGPVTTEEKAQKKNDVKARSMLLMALSNEHLMTFNQYKDAKTLFAAIQTRFGGNEATKKTQKTILKKMYENFSAPSTESLNSIFNRLQKIVSQLAILDTMSFDDLYNNFNIVEQEVKGTASSSSSSQNMVFVSSPSNINEVNTAYGVSTTNTQVSPASTQVSTASTQFALLSMRTRRFFQKTGRKITINGSDIAGYDKSKVECFNCHKIRHFARECRGPRNQDNKNRNQDSSRRTINVEETSSKAMVAINGAGFDWSYMADDEVPTNIALMVFHTLSLDKLIGSQITDKSRKGMGFVSYNIVPPPHTGLFSPPNLDLSYSGLEEFKRPEFEGYGPKSSKSVSEDIYNEVRKSLDAPLIKELVSNDKLEKKTIFPTIAKIEFVHPQKEDQGYVDSGCSRHMPGNMSYLTDFKEFDGGYVTFGGGARGGRITDKGTLKTAEAVNTACYVQNRVIIVKPYNKTPYELYRGRTPALSFMRPFGCHITILNSLDHLGKFDGKSDDGFFVGYSLTIKAFRWLFDIASLTKSMNYVPVVADGSLFDSSSKNSSDDEPQPSSNIEKKDDKGVSKASGFSDQEQPESSTLNINTVGPSINTTSANFKTGSLNINIVSPIVVTIRSNCSQNVSDMFSLGGSATLEATHSDLFGDETEMDMSNLTTLYQVPTTPNTRIHKDHSLDHVIGDIQSGVQTRGMTKNTNEHGFISAVYEGKTHEDLHTYGCEECFPLCIIAEDVYVYGQPPRFEDAEDPDKLDVKELLVVTDVRTASTQWIQKSPLLKDSDGDDVDVYLYRRSIMD